MKWNDGKTAPKNGNQFIADIGYGFAVVAAWNEIGSNFVYADLQATNEDDHAQLDVWWETEWCEVVVEQWMPMPEVK